jgi:hypothetical protein
VRGPGSPPRRVGAGGGAVEVLTLR